MTEFMNKQLEINELVSKRFELDENAIHNCLELMSKLSGYVVNMAERINQLEKEVSELKKGR